MKRYIKPMQYSAKQMAALLLLGLAACNTFNGMEEDLRAAGNAIAGWAGPSKTNVHAPEPPDE